jgi:hypothetical protein
MTTRQGARGLVARVLIRHRNNRTDDVENGARLTPLHS